MTLYAILFLSGASVLALELLASRIMTPYFGVSLYIWTGILSMTLIALALGYWAGGLLSASRRAAGNVARLSVLFGLLPAIASLAVAAACLVYPWLFPRLGDIAVQKFEKQPDGSFEETTVWADIFDSHWQLGTAK